MHSIKSAVIFLSVLLLISCELKKKSTFSDADIGIIPAPNLVTLSGSTSDNSELKIFIPDNLSSEYLRKLLSETQNAKLVEDEKSANVFIKIDKSAVAESYKIVVGKDKVTISTGGASGLQYAITSLSQMVTHNGYPLPIVIIEDSPGFGYRGMHLDVGRHFFDVSDIKKYLDYMAYYKYNNFHWHLTEDQGWRLEIKKYPKLQEIAAFRKETLIGHNNEPPLKYDGQRYGGFYTHEEVKEIVAYASSRNINVIPEIEMPGHSQAALAAYPEFGCEDKKYETATHWGVFEDVFCPNEVTFKFLEDVIDEVISLFPSKYIHIGGDECPKEAWKKSTYCQKLIKKEGLQDEHGLQSYFITRMEKYINAKGKQIIGWDEILEGGLAPNATVMSWRGIDGGLEAARQNHNVIMTPGSHCYFDNYQSESPDEPLAIGGFLNVEKVYHWNPVPEELEADKRKYIIGGQANLWTEYIKDYPGVEYMVYARGLAMSEALWSKNKNYKAFLGRYEKHNDFWKSNGANIAYHMYELNPKIIKSENKGVYVRFELPEGTEITHTSSAKSTEKKDTVQEIQINESGVHIFQAGKGNKSGKELRMEFDFHLATNAKIITDPAPSPKYSGNGIESIINGLKGINQRFKNDEWLGFDSTDAAITIDFGSKIDFNSIDCRFFKAEGSWIYLPSSVIVQISDDGKVFSKLVETQNISTSSKVAELTFGSLKAKARYIKLIVKNHGLISEGQPGAGKKPWLFVDEIIVK